MNRAVILVGGGLAVAVVAQGAYITRTRSQVEALSAKLEAIESGRRGGDRGDDRGDYRGDDEGRAPDHERPAEGMRVGVANRSRPSVPRFVAEPGAGTTDDPLPLPAAVSSPEAREQLRQFVKAQMERERQENRIRGEERREQATKERRDQFAKELGLSPAETEKFMKVQTDLDAARAALRTRIEAGQVDRGAVRQEMGAVRAKAEQQLREVLGDERLQKYQELSRNQQRNQRNSGGPGPAGRGFPGGFRGPDGVPSGASPPAPAAAPPGVSP